MSAICTPTHLQWTARHTAAIAAQADHVIQVIAPGHRSLPADQRHAMDLWDMWPVEQADGTAVPLGTGTLWMGLVAPRMSDPDARHGLARIHFLHRETPGSAGAWSILDPVFPDRFTPGSREWSGSALFDPGTARLTVFFTATGRRDDDATTFEQRIFQASGDLAQVDGTITVTNWSGPQESFRPDGQAYLRETAQRDAGGMIKAFRDPGFFEDPRDGARYVFFTASSAQSASPWNGRIGVACAPADTIGPWRLMDPVVCADGLNAELERPHMRKIGTHYYLFWSTHGKVFAPGTPAAPTGLYGAVAPTPLGPFAPLNGTGLVAGNPGAQPLQGYSWWVLPDLSVNSFVDCPAARALADLAQPTAHRAAFQGHVAPFFTLVVDGDRARVAPGA